MERFIHRANIEHFGRLLALATDDAERLRIAKLLAEEQAKDRRPLTEN
jgi:hypothetical protein